MLSGEETGGQLAVLDIRCAPGGGPPPHTEPTHAFFRVIDGEIQFSLERNGMLEKVVLHPGDTAFVPAGTGHGFSNASGRPARMIVVGQPAGLEEFIAEVGQLIPEPDNPPPPPKVHDRASMEEIFKRHGVKAFGSDSAVWVTEPQIY
jgi:quercetin dioxygenase-like cupin family protein